MTNKHKKTKNLKKSKLSNWVLDQKLIALSSLSDLLKQPITFFITCSVIALALVFPVLLSLINGSIDKVVKQLNPSDEISIYINKASTDRAIVAFENQLSNNSKILDSRFISPEEGILDLEEWAGIGQVLNLLDENPLPPVIVISPLADLELKELEALVRELQKNPIVEYAKLDFEWIARVQKYSAFFQKLVNILWFLLSLGVVLIMGHSIKMVIESRRQEIIIVKMVGGTNKFVSRPFLYLGFWVGLFSGFLAWIVIQISLILLAESTQRLINLYDVNFKVITGLGLQENLLLFFVSAFLGYLGALLAVKRNISKIEPQ